MAALLLFMIASVSASHVWGVHDTTQACHPSGGISAVHVDGMQWEEGGGLFVGEEEGDAGCCRLSSSGITHCCWQVAGVGNLQNPP